jgi:SAM-dependent methyltransferase
VTDTWNDGAGYEAYVGRWSRVVAVEFLRWLGLPPGSNWLDAGCGTGALSQAILDQSAPRLVAGCDRAEAYVSFARQLVSDQRATFTVAEFSDLPVQDGGFDAVVAGLVLNFLPDPVEGVKAMRRRGRSGGTVAAYVWDYALGMELMRIFWDTAMALDPGAGALDEATRFPICRPEPLATLFRSAGLDRVTVQPIVVPTVFRDFQDYWTPFLQGQGPAPGYLTNLTPEARLAFEAALRRRLPMGDDGTIRLQARAWAVRGIVR